MQISEPEDTCELYLIDMAFARYHPTWERAYDSLPGSMMSSQGCLDMLRWYTDYKAKIRFHVFDKWLFTYRFLQKNNFDRNLLLHSFEALYKIYKRLYSGIYVSPSFYKYNDEAAFIISWYKTGMNNIVFHIGVPHFDRNFSLKYVKPGDTINEYRPIPTTPIHIRIEAKIKFQKAYIRYHYSHLSEEKSLYLMPQEGRFDVYRIFKDSSSIFIDIPFKNILTTGINASWENRDSIYLKAFDNNVYHDSLNNLSLEAFIYKTFKKGEAYLGLLYSGKKRLTTSYLYERPWYGLNLRLKYSIFSFMDAYTGFQWSRRQRYVNGDTLTKGWRNKQSRLIIALDFKFPNGIHFLINEGIETDPPLEYMLSHPHNHTYISLFMPFKPL